MKARLGLLASLLLGFSTCAWATDGLSAEINALAAPGSEHFVTIMNNLYNPAIDGGDHTKSDIMVRYYDGTGTHPPCWTENKIEFRSDPNVAGAGGRNACGKDTKDKVIAKVDILPLKNKTGMKVYEDLTDIQIDKTTFYNIILVEQEKAPVYYPNGSLKTMGTLKVRQKISG